MTLNETNFGIKAASREMAREENNGHVSSSKIYIVQYC